MNAIGIAVMLLFALAWFLELTPACTCWGRDTALAAHK